MRRKVAVEASLFPSEPIIDPRSEADARAALANELYADVALNRPVRCEFTYAVPRSVEPRAARAGEPRAARAVEPRAGRDAEPRAAHSVEALVAPGVRVAVWLGNRREVGVVVRVHREPAVERARIKPIASVLDSEPLVDEPLLELTRWMAAYYACAWGEALSAILPSALKREGKARESSTVVLVKPVADADLEAMEKKKPRNFRLLRMLRDARGPVDLREACRRLNLTRQTAVSLEQEGWVKVERHAEPVDPLATSRSDRVRPETLSPDQTRALDAIAGAVRERASATFLLKGVTGSGKTEVYLRAIEEALALGRGAIVIVPEIALTPQTVGWFRSRFGAIAVLHSRMTEARRRATWLAVKRGEFKVVVGARSAVFAPVVDLGVIVVDEEHEPSFKQGETAPRYHAREVAVERARRVGGVCILGSATPSLESWQHAREGRYRMLELRERIQGRKLPRIEVVDMRGERSLGKEPALISHKLRALLAKAIERKEQSILFLNRRGFAVTLWCSRCGETARCAHCDVALTFHRRIQRVVCHSCCDELPPPKACPACTAPALRYLGAGSERIETALAELFPAARISRMDSDTMLRHEDYEDVLGRFGRGEIDVLVGTQMIAKGLDFPGVTVVGIVSADSALHLPDFRSAERTFQLLSQVAGRAGRGAAAGEIIVQTVTPAHPAVVHAARHDYDGFAIGEMRLREELGYPPFGKLVRVVFEDEQESMVHSAARAFADALRSTVDACGSALLGPAEAPIAMVRGRHRHHLLVKVPLRADALDRVREACLALAEPLSRPRVTIDVDPIALL